jgi:DNA-binding Lrp family transcriptional regulator
VPAQPNVTFLYDVIIVVIWSDFMSLVYVLMNTEPSLMENVLKEIKEIKGVAEAYMVYGTYDICAKVSAEKPQELKAIVQKIRSKDNVLNTLTLMVVQ